MQTDYHKKNEKGFVLAVVAMLLMIIGIFMLKSFPLSTDVTAKDVQRTGDRLLEIKRALLIYYEKNGSLPCPFDPTRDFENNNLGIAEGTCSGGGIVVNGTVVQGGLPVKDLGLPLSYIFDEWGGRITYVMDRSYTAFKEGGTSILVKNKQGSAITGVGGSTIPKFMGLLISHGPNGIGAYNQGIRVAAVRPSNKACAGGVALNANENENCDDDLNFYMDKWGDDNDDLLEYLTPCPGAVNGCAVWLDAGDVDGDNNAATPANASAVATWVDKSGSGYAVTQTTGANQPSYTSNGLNGRAVLNFDGTDDFFMNTGFPIETKTTVFTVAKQTGGTGFRRIVNFGSTTDIYGLIGTGSTNTFASFYGNGTAWNDLATNSPSLQSNAYFSSFVSSNNGTTATPYVNGYAQGTKVGTTAQTTGFRAGSSGSSSQFWFGDMAEIIIYNQALTDTNRKRVECSLARKWATFPRYGLQLWLDANDVDNDGNIATPADGSSISTWTDKSGNGYNATQLTPGNQPTYESAGEQNGKAVLRFNGSKNMATVAIPNYSQAFVVFKRSSVDMPVIQTGNNQYRGFASTGGTFPNYSSYSQYGINGATYAAAYPAAAVGSNYYIVAGRTATASTQIWDIGLGTPSYSNLNGDIAEIIVYNRVLSDEERTLTECYLSEKWNIAITTP